MRLAAVGSLCCLLAGTALAAPPSSSPPTKLDSAALARPSIGPAPPWVLPPPAATSAPSGAEGDATIILLADTQRKFAPGETATLYHTTYKIATNQGLSDGPLQLDWDPALEELTVHQYRILRDGKAMDLLGDGSKMTVVRREKDLENATLDGKLTAFIQPDDLQVGDLIEFAYTRVRHDPAMAGHTDDVLGPADGQSFGHYRLRLIWPDSVKLRWHDYPGLIHPTLSHKNGQSELLADLSNATTARAPRGAPARFSVVNAVEVTDFPSWAAVARNYLPLFDAATRLSAGSQVKAEAERIKALSPDPKRRAELALQLVQDKIRYLFLAMSDGGFVPAPADLTWSRRYGDCKAKTALLVALLREMQIDARPLLVNTTSGDFVASRMPAMGSFDHVITEVRLGGRTYYLDGTRLGDEKLDRLVTPPYVVGLPVAVNTTALERLTPVNPALPSETASLNLDASEGVDVPARASGELRYRGETATDMRIKYAAYSASDRDTELRKLWRKTYDFLTPTSVTTRVDPANGDYVLAMTGTAKMDWFKDNDTRWYEMDRARLGWKLDLSRDGMIETGVPYAFDFPDHWASRETIILPNGGKGFRMQGEEPVEETVGGLYRFHRKVALDKGVVTMETSTQALGSELPAAQSQELRTRMATLLGVGVYIRLPSDYVRTDADMNAIKGDKAAYAGALVHRAALHSDAEEIKEGLADINGAITTQPNNALAHAIRALLLAQKGDEGATAEADKAVSLDPKVQLIGRARAILALNKGRFDDAEQRFGLEIAASPDDPTLFTMRATSRIDQGRFAEALSDIEQARKLAPSVRLDGLHATVVALLGRLDEALAETDGIVAAHPDEPTVALFRARLHRQVGRQDQAMTELNALIAKTPTAAAYLERAALWNDDHRPERRGDLQSALKLEPRSINALAQSALEAADARDSAGAEQAIAAVTKLQTTELTSGTLRMQLFARTGRLSQALQIADEQVRRYPTDGGPLNERCWLRATHNVDLAKALADCDAAIKLSRWSPAYLDSRALVRLRMDDVTGARADYDAALRLQPYQASSLFGRALVRSRAGESREALADLALARRIEPGVEARFAGYGVRLADATSGTRSASR